MSVKSQCVMTATVLFFVLGNPVIYTFVDQLLGGLGLRVTKDEEGCPTQMGVIVHALVFYLIYNAMCPAK
jgi:hypothetical protein